MHPYGFESVVQALRNNQLCSALQNLGMKLEPANTKVSLNALERIRQLAIYLAVLDLARSAVKEVIAWFRANDRGGSIGGTVTGINQAMELVVAKGINESRFSINDDLPIQSWSLIPRDSSIYTQDLHSLE